MNNQNTASQNELISNQWYIIYLSVNLKKKPVTIKRLGLNLVLYRDKNGSPVCASAQCPHRGADLGLGKVVNGQLQCKYHGFCFNSKGSCTLMPCEGKDAIIPPSLSLETHQIREENGFIWFWFGDQNPASEIPNISGSFTPDKDDLTFDFDWDLNLSRVIEGMMDFHHLPFAHSPWIPKNLTRLDPYDVSISNNVIYTNGVMRDENANDKGGLAGKINVAFPGHVNFAFGNRNGKTGVTKYGFEAVGTLTPIDENTTWIAIYYRQSYVKVPLISAIFSYVALQFDFRLIQPDDYLLLKSSEPKSSSLKANHLARSDRGIAEWHRLKESLTTQVNESTQLEQIA